MLDCSINHAPVICTILFKSLLRQEKPVGDLETRNYINKRCQVEGSAWTTGSCILKEDWPNCTCTGSHSTSEVF